VDINAHYGAKQIFFEGVRWSNSGCKILIRILTQKRKGKKRKEKKRKEKKRKEKKRKEKKRKEKEARGHREKETWYCGSNEEILDESSDGISEIEKIGQHGWVCMLLQKIVALVVEQVS
jgi:hypothetical protein